MTPAGIFIICCVGIAYGILWRITQAVLWLLNGHRS